MIAMLFGCAQQQVEPPIVPEEILPPVQEELVEPEIKEYDFPVLEDKPQPGSGELVYSVCENALTGGRVYQRSSCGIDDCEKVFYDADGKLIEEGSTGMVPEPHVFETEVTDCVRTTEEYFQTKTIKDSRVFDSEESCKAVNDYCVALMEDGQLSGKFVAHGDVQEGEHVDLGLCVYSNDPQCSDEPLCTDNLKAVRDFEVSESGACLAPACNCRVCTACGDGECGVGENECNCLDDCKSDRPVFTSEEECEASGDVCVPLLTRGPALYVQAGSVKEGESFSVPPDMTTKTRVCEEDLFAVTKIDLLSDGSCSGPPMCMCYTCLKCGDGICGPGENYCNCNRDCFIKE